MKSTELLDQLDQLRASIGDSPAFSVVGFAQDENEVLAEFDDGGFSVFAQAYGIDAAALIVAAVNALPALTAAIRRVLAEVQDWPAADFWHRDAILRALSSEIVQ